MKYLPKPIKLLLAIMALLATNACIRNNAPVNATALAAYLAATCTHSIKPDALYIIIPAFACPGCIDDVLQQLKSRPATPDIVVIGVAGTKAGLAGLLDGLGGYITCADVQNTFLKTFSAPLDKPYYILMKHGRIAAQGAASPENLNELHKLIGDIPAQQ